MKVHTQGHTYTGGLESESTSHYTSLQRHVGNFNCHITTEHT